MLKNNQLVGAIKSPTSNRSGPIIPKFIVMHYTASWEVGSVLKTFGSPASRVSAHITVDTDGTVYQHVPFNIKAWHAGPSAYAGYTGLNNHSIGIEIVNPGFCRKRGDVMYDAYGHRAPESFDGEYVRKRHHRVGGGTYYWPEYPDLQLDAVEKATRALIHAYDIRDIVSHEEIDLRGWKTDPGPAFPMRRFKALINPRDLDEEKYQVTASSLNVRGGPGTEFAVISRETMGTTVSVRERSGSWARISSDGWVHSAYLRVA